VHSDLIKAFQVNLKALVLLTNTALGNLKLVFLGDMLAMPTHDTVVIIFILKEEISVRPISWKVIKFVHVHLVVDYYYYCIPGNFVACIFTIMCMYFIRIFILQISQTTLSQQSKNPHTLYLVGKNKILCIK